MWRTSNHYNAFSKWKNSLVSWEKLDNPSFPKRLKDVFYAEEGLDLIIANKISLPSLEIARDVFCHHPLFTLFEWEEFNKQYKKNPRFFREQYRPAGAIKFRLVKENKKYADLILSLSRLFIERNDPTFNSFIISFNTLITSHKERLWVLFDKIISYEKWVKWFFEHWCKKNDLRREILTGLSPDYWEDMCSDEEFDNLIKDMFQEEKIPL